MQTIEVDLGERSYPVLVGPGVRADLAAVLPERIRRVAVVTQEGIDVDVDPGRPFETFLIGDGERHKTLSTIESLCSAFARWGLTRADCVVAVGGGIVTDVGGFAASVYHRGIPVVHVATSLLAQVDAAIGGKTGVNLPEGKNLVGAYWRPISASSVFWSVAVASTTSTWMIVSLRACRSRPTWLPPTSGRAVGGRSSTTATRWRTRSRRRAGTGYVTARRSRSA